MKYPFILMLVFLLIVTPATAQDSGSDCDLTALVEAMGITSDTITVGDMDATLNALSSLENLISRTRAECAGLAFDSEIEGLQPVLGPITLEPGIWIATATTEAAFIGQMTLLDGECESGFGALFNESSGQLSNGAQKIIESNGCTFLLQISNAREPWTLTFESVSDLTPRPTEAIQNLGTGINLGRVVSATGIDRDGCPVEITSTFEASESVYVIAEGSDVPRGTTVFVRLYHDGQPIEDAPEITADQDYNNTCINFVFEPEGSNFDPGNYEAEFIINGIPTESASFEIR